MGRYDGLLLMSDFDGTLGNETDGVSRENCEAIRKFQNGGGLFSLASGRYPSFMLKFKNVFVPNAWSVMLNGTYICDSSTENIAFSRPLDRDAIGFVNEVCRMCPDLDYVRFHSHDKFVMPDAMGNFDYNSLPLPIYKLIFHTPGEHSDEYYAKIKALAASGYYVSRSWIHGIELQPSGTSKGDAVARLRELHGSRAQTIVAVGDYENDIEMLQRADIGYATGNALQKVKDAADRVAPDYREHAIAAIIEQL